MKRLFKSLFRTIFTVITIVLRFLFPSRLVVAHARVVVPSLRHSLNRTVKIVQLSDFHLDTAWPDKIASELLARAIALANQQQPDLILLTGDYVDRDPKAVRKIVPYLKQLRAKHGIFASLGNHDYKESYEGRSLIVRVIEEECGIPVLTCATVRPFAEHPTFEIVGIGDLVSALDFQPTRAFAHAQSPESEASVTRLLMSHNPDTFVRFLPWKVDLQFAGHTHGGQICYPKSGTPVLRHLRALHDALPSSLSALKRLFPIHVHAIDNWDYVSGHHTLTRNDGGVNQLYVSRGLGTHPPCRINCPCEVNVIELVPS